MGIIVCCHPFSNIQHRMMSKQFFALSLLIAVVSARYPFDRQLQEGADQGTGNEWQYCEDTCNKTCEPCEQHHVCAEDEIKCGEGPTRVSPDGFVLHLCAKDEICVSDKCGCPVPGNDGELCPVVCECDCNEETEICCPSGEDSNGCTIQPTCEPKGKNMYNEICPGFCVEACEYNEIPCEQPDDPNNGCPHPDNCQAKQVDNSGKFCDLQQCQLVCDYTQHLCEGDIRHDGCKENDICVPSNLMILLQTVCAQELVQLNARTGKSNVMEQLITTVTFTRDAKVKMFATPRLKMSTECSVLENLIPMVALILAHLKKSCVQPRKDLLGAKKQPHVKTEQPMMKENIAQTPLTAQLFAHQIMSIAQEELTKMDARTLIFV